MLHIREGRWSSRSRRSGISSDGATARLRYCELALRGLAGGAFVLQAPHMRFGSAFAVAGWGLLLTTAILAPVPWRAFVDLGSFAARFLAVARQTRGERAMGWMPGTDSMWTIRESSASARSTAELSGLSATTQRCLPMLPGSRSRRGCLLRGNL